MRSLAIRSSATHLRAARLEPAGREQLAQRREHQIVADRTHQCEPFTLSVFGNERNAEPGRFVRAAMLFVAVKNDSPPLAGSAPKIARATSVRPEPTRPQRPTISPSRTTRPISAIPLARRKPLHFEQRLSRRRCEGPRIGHVHGPPDHHPHQFIGGGADEDQLRRRCGRRAGH